MPPRKRASKAATPSTSPTASLSGLPPELRLRIYKFFSADLPGHNFISNLDLSTPSQYMENSAITLVCRLTHEEASPILWQHPVLLLHVSDNTRGREDSSPFHFTDIKHFRHIRRATLCYYQLDETVTDEEYVARVKKLMEDLQYGAIFDAIHIGHGDLHFHNLDRANKTIEIFASINCAGTITVQRHHPSQWVDGDEVVELEEALEELAQKLNA
ncbi:hypothetical protein LTR95_004565 [Oleoguttula sp. CCFEE 5521]